MSTLRMSAFALSFFACSFCVPHRRAGDPAMGALRDAVPAATWDRATPKIADVTCDGISDTIVMGYETKDAVWVGISFLCG